MTRRIGDACATAATQEGRGEFESREEEEGPERGPHLGGTAHRARTPPNLGRPLSPLIIRLPSRDVSHLPRRWCALAHRRAHTNAFTCTDAKGVDAAHRAAISEGVRYPKRFPEFGEVYNTVELYPNTSGDKLERII